MLCALPSDASSERRRVQYEDLRLRLEALLEGESDLIAMLATVTCELHHAFEGFQWTGFYRVTAPGMLTIGPYQGTHGCLRIPFGRGVCGAAAQTGRTQRVEDVRDMADHIACSASTRSEIVVPVRDDRGTVVAVLDVDSDICSYFMDVDRSSLETICEALGKKNLHVSLKGSCRVPMEG